MQKTKAKVTKRIRLNAKSGGNDPTLYANEVWATLERQLINHNRNSRGIPYISPAPAEFNPPHDLRKLMDAQHARQGKPAWTPCMHLNGGSDKIT